MTLIYIMKKLAFMNPFVKVKYAVMVSVLDGQIVIGRSIKHFVYRYPDRGLLPDIAG